MFEDSGFEIYETMTTEYAAKDIYDEPGGPNKHVLEVREVLDDIKNMFYSMNAFMADWDTDRRNKVSKQFVSTLRRITGPVRQQGAREALKQLDEAGHGLEALMLSGSDGEDGDSKVDNGDGEGDYGGSKGGE